MLKVAWQTADSYLEFYRQFFLNEWNQMTPMKYGLLLVGIGVFGWVLMKNASKR